MEAFGRVSGWDGFGRKNPADFASEAGRCVGRVLPAAIASFRSENDLKNTPGDRAMIFAA